MKILTKVKENIVFLCFIFLAFLGLFHHIFFELDTDFYHILNSGKWIWENKTFMHENVTFVGEGYQTVVQQWLYSVCMYAFYLLGGVTGVKVFAAIQLVVLIFVMNKYLKLQNVRFKNSLLAIAASLLVTQVYIQVRPQMISLILIYLQLYILEKFRQTRKTGILYLLPVLTLLEANLHCTFWIFHYVFILPYVVPFNRLSKALFKKETFVQDTTIKIKPLILPMLLMAGSVFINPYGAKGVTCLLYQGSLSLIEVGELQPLHILSEYFLYLVLGIIATVILIIKKKITSSTLYTVIGTSLIYIISRRNIIFYSIGILFILKDVFNCLNTDKFYTFVNKLAGKEKAVVAICMAIILSFSTVGVAGKFVDKGDLPNDSEFTPVYAIKYLEENEDELSELRIFTTFNAGSYFLYKGVGRVYVEAKTEGFAEGVNGKKDIFAEYAYIKDYANAEGIKEFLQEYNFDYLYITCDFTGLQTYLDLSDDYECVVEGKEITIAKEDTPLYRLYKKTQKG